MIGRYTTDIPAIIWEYKAEEPARVTRRWATMPQSDTELLVEFLRQGIELLDKADAKLVRAYPSMFTQLET